MKKNSNKTGVDLWNLDYAPSIPNLFEPLCTPVIFRATVDKYVIRVIKSDATFFPKYCIIFNDIIVMRGKNAKELYKELYSRLVKKAKAEETKTIRKFFDKFKV